MNDNNDKDKKKKKGLFDFFDEDFLIPFWAISIIVLFFGGIYMFFKGLPNILARLAQILS